jgi:signal transduction histidine kinase
MGTYSDLRMLRDAKDFNIDVITADRTGKDSIGFAVTGKKYILPDGREPEYIEKIWIKFYKVDKARTREYGGSGIGLSIVKAIMKSHNQECGVINRPIGVEFWFELDTQA